MNKSELIEKLSADSKLPPRLVERSVNLILSSVADTLAEDKRVEIRGFGSFCDRKRKPRPGRNQKTGEKISVPPKKVPLFKTGKELKERVDATFQKMLQR